MTSEEKQALIKFAESVLANYESGSYMAGTKSESLIRIALATLTAQPVKCQSFDDYKPHAAEELRAAFIAAIRATGYEVQE
jgi:hypothetical protein